MITTSCNPRPATCNRREGRNPMRIVQWEYRESVRRVYVETNEPPAPRQVERLPAPRRSIPALPVRAESTAVEQPARMGTGSALGLGSAAGAAIVLLGLAASRANRHIRELPPEVRPAALGRQLVHRLRAVPSPRALGSGTTNGRDG
jgi:hypothetical protein